MSDTLVAIFFGVGVSGWLYSKLSHRTGNAVPKTTYLTAGFIGLIAAIVIFTVFKFVLHV